MKILIACEASGRVRDAFLAKGHDAMSCDLKPTERPGPHRQGDVREILNDGWDMMIAHPVCKRLANSGVRWLHKPPKGKTVEQMWEDLRAGAEFYKLLRDADIKKKCIENPIMHKYAKEIIRPGYRQVVQPWWFGEEVFKATGFELINLPDLAATNKLTPPKSGTEEHKAWSAIHRESPGPNREANRSRTFQGVADAMAEQWG
jgi:hypothetical protein